MVAVAAAAAVVAIPDVVSVVVIVAAVTVVCGGGNGDGDGAGGSLSNNTIMSRDREKGNKRSNIFCVFVFCFNLLISKFHNQGTKSTTDERGASAIFAQRIDDNELGGAAVQVKLT